MNRLVSGYVNTVSLGMSLVAKRQALKRLDQLGLRLHFSRIPAGWVSSLQPADLTEVWHEAGLKIEGVGYSTIGALVEGTHTSARFWPTSPFYQAWLGGYLFQAPTEFETNPVGEICFENLLRLPIVSQCAWLRNYGCSNPRAVLKPGSFQLLEEARYQDYPSWLVQGAIETCSDVGAGNRYPNGYTMYRAYELMFARFGAVHLPALCTLPPIWPLASYHPLDLDYLGLLVRIGQRSHWAFLFCCGARWAGREYLPFLRDDALDALRQVRIVSA